MCRATLAATKPIFPLQPGHVQRTHPDQEIAVVDGWPSAAARTRLLEGEGRRDRFRLRPSRPAIEDKSTAVPESTVLAGARRMDEGSSSRIKKLRRRNGLAEDGARHIISEGENARQRYHSELENAVRHIKKQHHNAEEMAQQF